MLGDQPARITVRNRERYGRPRPRVTQVMVHPETTKVHVAPLRQPPLYTTRMMSVLENTQTMFNLPGADFHDRAAGCRGPRRSTR